MARFHGTDGSIIRKIPESPDRLYRIRVGIVAHLDRALIGEEYGCPRQLDCAVGGGRPAAKGMFPPTMVDSAPNLVRSGVMRGVPGPRHPLPLTSAF
jgi:hypothetical protein